MSKLFEAFANIFRIPDLRKRVLFTLALLAVYRRLMAVARRLEAHERRREDGAG